MASGYNGEGITINTIKDSGYLVEVWASFQMV